MRELTDQEITQKIKEICTNESLSKGFPFYPSDFVLPLLKQLQSERAKVKDSVWEFAQPWQNRARIKFYSDSRNSEMDETFKDYTRLLPRTLEEELVKKYVTDIEQTKTLSKPSLDWYLKSMLKEYADKLEANHEKA